MPTKRKDGLLQASFTLVNPFSGKKKRVYVYGRTEAELNRQKKEILDEFASHFASGGTKFHEFARDYLIMKRDEDGLEPTTIASYQQELKKYILPEIPEDTEVAEITVEMCRYLLARIPGIRTRAMVYTLLNAMFKEAMFRQIVTANPMAYIHKPKHRPKQAELVSPGDYRRLIGAVGGTMWEYLYKFAWDTGLRRGEMCALRWGDVDFDRATLKVSRSMKRVAGKGYYEGIPKTANSIREIVLSPEAVDNLKAWRKELMRRLAADGKPFDLGGHVWRSTDDATKLLPLITVTNGFADLKKRLGFAADVRFHSFRHTHATLLAQGDLSAKKIQARLGHATAAFTLDRYVHNTPAMQEGVVSVLERAQSQYRRRF